MVVVRAGRSWYRVTTAVIVAILLGTSPFGAVAPGAASVSVASASPAAQIDCDDAFTPIPAIQGPGAVSPKQNETVTIKGVVTGTFLGGERLRGFFLQEIDGDGDPLTSDGIFVFVPAPSPALLLDVQPDTIVALRGRVTEFNGRTDIGDVEGLTACGPGTVAPTPLTLTEVENQDLERFEGMLVTIPEMLTVSETFLQLRLGLIVLAFDGRPFVPTSIHSPGSPEAENLAELHPKRRLVIDDGSRQQRPEPIPYLDADGTRRAGDTVTGLTGVLDFEQVGASPSVRGFKIQPTVPPPFVSPHPRTLTPEPVGGTVTVAGANVLNYFNGNGSGGGFTGPTQRGASNLDEFGRQRDKIVAAIAAIDADVVGLMEMENDGTGPDSAIRDLIDNLNAEIGPGTYDFVHEPASGTDFIKVAMLFKPGRVTPVGDPINHQAPDGPSGHLFERPPLAQTFRLNSSSARLTVVVNHFKSKRSCPEDDDDEDADQGDGQACWNARRVRQAESLLTFVDTLRAASDDRVLVIGDLNANGKEDPIRALTEGGLVNEIARFVPTPYSFMFDGQAGYLDHALTTSALSEKVTGVTEWHINCDEPEFLDYNTEGRPLDLFLPTPFRSSDHDPVIIGFNL